MIQIRYHISDKNNTISKKIEFDKSHEKNLDMMYESTIDAITRNEELTLYQLLIVCSYHIVKKTRENPIQEIIEYHLLEKLERPSLAAMFCQIKKITADILVDTIPKRTISIEPTKKIILAAQRALM